MDLKTFKQKRGGVKMQLTLFNNYLNDISKAELTVLQVQNLQNRLTKVIPLLDYFVELQNEIDCLHDNEDDNTKELQEFQDKYFDLTSKAEIIISQFNNNSVDESASNVSVVSHKNSTVSHIPFRGTKVKLPTITLPTFDGTFTQWREFKDKFTSLIHSDNELSNIQKLTYLKSSLKGEPADLLISLETTDQNYQIAWNRLEKRYNNKRRIVNNHVQALLDIPQTSRDSYQSLRHLINTTQNHIDCLRTFEIPVKQWDALIVPILASKVDSHTNKEWEAKLNHDNSSNDKVPSLDEFLEFINIKQATLETTFNRGKHEQKSVRETKTFTTLTSNHCVHCNQTHTINNCEEFSKLTAYDRNKRVRELRVCLNCLRKGHFAQACQSKNTCRKCKGRHHTLLHIEKATQFDKKEITVSNSAVVKAATESETGQVEVYTASTSTTNADNNSQVLLSIAKVYAINGSNSREVRILLDSASQSHFITESLCNLLKLKSEQINFAVKGISGSSKITKKVQVTIKSRCKRYTTTLTCLVIPEITNNLPVHSINIQSLQIPATVKLADPTFYQSGQIDILIGAELFWELICVGQIKEKNTPIIQKTKLGWVVTGNYQGLNSNEKIRTVSHSYLSLNDLHNNVERFWNADEYTNNKDRALSTEETYCENFFTETTTRDETGKCIVKIPFKSNINQLGDSTTVANNRFLSIEKRLANDSNLREQYTKFMTEYEVLNHMTKIENVTETGFLLPHHAVINNSSQTTKLRVVFDGSCELNNGIPINAKQCNGPTIQDELFSIIARFRMYKYVTTADVTKMYRQVWIHPNDRKYPQIFWRANSDDNLNTYELNTVTYGTTAAPFLAIRCLIQLGMENERMYSIESQIIKHDFYVDDLLTGANSVSQLQEIKTNLNKILNSGGFELRKWTSNVQSLNDSVLNKQNSVSITENIHKTLGVFWCPQKDLFCYTTKNIKPQGQVTKRTILSVTSQLFDPLGFLDPTIILAKFIIQDLWKSKVGWDETVPIDIQTRWLAIKDKLKHINNIKIPRFALLSESNKIELHAFSDASEHGYGACIYVKSIDSNQQVQISLLAAKSRVAPLKTISLPRVELCAAVIAAQLVAKFMSILNISIAAVHCWSDSTIVLCWIKSQANKYHVYVANRITEIQNLTKAECWRHVKSQDNPADLYLVVYYQIS